MKQTILSFSCNTCGNEQACVIEIPMYLQGGVPAFMCSSRCVVGPIFDSKTNWKIIKRFD